VTRQLVVAPKAQGLALDAQIPEPRGGLAALRVEAPTEHPLALEVSLGACRLDLRLGSVQSREGLGHASRCPPERGAHLLGQLPLDLPKGTALGVEAIAQGLEMARCRRTSDGLEDVLEASAHPSLHERKDCRSVTRQSL
jgi:hypothetical protein